MATPALLFLEFGGEERPFRCLHAELRKIQANCDAGPSEIARRLAQCVRVQRQYPKASILEQAVLGLGDWRIEDVREPILQGLIGGGMTAGDAFKLVRSNIDERGMRGLVEHAELALTVMLTGAQLPEDYPAPGETRAGEEGTMATSPAGSGTSTPSTEPAAPSA